MHFTSDQWTTSLVNLHSASWLDDLQESNMWNMNYTVCSASLLKTEASERTSISKHYHRLSPRWPWCGSAGRVGSSANQEVGGSAPARYWRPNFDTEKSFPCERGSCGGERESDLHGQPRRLCVCVTWLMSPTHLRHRLVLVFKVGYPRRPELKPGLSPPLPVYSTGWFSPSN